MRWASFATVFLAGLFALACGEEENQQPQPNPQEQLQFERIDLVSDVAGLAPVTDPNLVNPWGLAFGSDTFIWVANAGSGTMTIYDGAGTPEPEGNPLVVRVPREIPEGGSAPDVTGMVFNGTDSFSVAEPVPGNPAQEIRAPARFIAALTDGSIVAWSPDVDAGNAITVVPPEEGDAYTGLAFSTDGDLGPLLFAANFPQREIEVFDTNFQNVFLDGAFEDTATPAIPSDYGPFSVHTLNSLVYVAYAQIDPTTNEEVHAAGAGFVSIYDLNGKFVQRLVSNGQLNAPWGIALAPDNFGHLSGALLVGNFGDGLIHAYDRKSGQLLDTVRDSSKNPIQTDGLWSITFGNGIMAGQTNDLFFTAGIEDETHGLFGKIRPVQ